MMWYLIVRSPAGKVDVYPAGSGSPNETLTAIGRAEAELGAAVIDPGWDVSVTCGEPHPSLLAVATVHAA